jgi:hypothetical protein
VDIIGTAKEQRLQHPPTCQLGQCIIIGTAKEQHLQRERSVASLHIEGTLGRR